MTRPDEQSCGYQPDRKQCNATGFFMIIPVGSFGQRYSMKARFRSFTIVPSPCKSWRLSWDQESAGPYYFLLVGVRSVRTLVTGDPGMSAMSLASIPVSFSHPDSRCQDRRRQAVPDQFCYGAKVETVMPGPSLSAIQPPKATVLLRSLTKLQAMRSRCSIGVIALKTQCCERGEAETMNLRPRLHGMIWFVRGIMTII